MKRNLIYLIGVACIVTSCILEDIKQPVSADGQEVIFSANLDGNVTRTTYDPIDISNPSGTVKVNWVQGDLISVYGTKCSVKQAEYSVEPAYDANGTATNYATSLNKTGAAGIQWGSDSESDFYAVYPSTDDTFIPTDDGAKVKTSIRTTQKNLFKYDSVRNCWVGIPYIDDVEKPTMPDALMFAATTASTSMEAVDLNFKPWSTVLKFRFLGFKYATVGAQHQTISIRRIILTAPSNADIAGNLDLNIKLPVYDKDGNVTTPATAIAVPDNSSTENEIVIEPDYLPLSHDQAVEFCVYTIPQAGLSFGTEETTLWKVKIEATDGQSFTYLMRPSSGNAALRAGSIHSIGIPYKQIEKPGDLSDFKENWMEKIPRNVYLSELSLPGSWYSTDKQYSGYTAETVTDGLKELYSKGVRAFHIDCRLTKSTDDDNYKLMCAGTEGERSEGGLFGLGAKRYVTGDEVLTQLETINSMMTEHKGEYVVVVLTIAEQPKKQDILSGHIGLTGTVLPSQVLPAIASVLSSESLTNLYRNTITPNTLVNDVLGKMIVMVNANTDKFSGYFNGPALISEASLSSSDNDEIVSGKFTSMQTRDLYWGNSKSDFKYYYHHAQRTLSAGSLTGIPNYDDRIGAIDGIIEASDQIYLKSSHDGWYMVGIGGYRKNTGNDDAENHTEIASRLNSHLADLVDQKIKKQNEMMPSPLGVVLMNYPIHSDYSGPRLVTAIMNMNAAFILAHDPTKPEWPN